MGRTRTRAWICGLIALIGSAGSALAEPIETTEATDTERVSFVCSVWVEPSGDQYEWTFVCGEIDDTDGDGTVDSRRGIVFRDLCDEPDPRRGSWCYGGETVAEAEVSASELTIDVGAGTASLHATLGACRVDVDWTATSPATQSESSEVPEIWPGLNAPAAYVFVRQRDYANTQRDASFAGSVCPEAEVSGPPQDGLMLDWETSEHRTTITIDPTA